MSGMCRSFYGVTGRLIVGLLTASTAAVAQSGDVSATQAAVASFGGGPIPVTAGACLTDDERAMIEAFMQVYARERSGRIRGCAPTAPKYGFYPMGGTPWRDLFCGFYNDLEPSGGILDFECTNLTYDGHEASDMAIRSFAEQVIGVPVFAAMDGVVIAAHDGEFDMNWGGQTGPANYCAIDHGYGRVAWYLHFKRDSVLVTEGQPVVAGQQIAMIGSSGMSGGPHLHFATYDGGQPYEPYAGSCRPGPSGWFEQDEHPRELRVLDGGLSRVDLGTQPPLPNALPRTGQFAFSDTVHQVWIMLQNVSADAPIHLRTVRPNGTVAAQSQFSLGNPAYNFASYYFNMPYSPELASVAGTWEFQVDIAGQNLVNAAAEVVPVLDADFNRPPLPVTIEFDPPAPRVDEVIFCRVNTSLLYDDPDYDVVRYEYVWTVDGQEIRRVVSAGQSDAIPRTYAQGGAVIACAVTPMDDSSSGPTVAEQITVETATFDCNGNFIDDAAEIAAGTSADANGNGVPDECESPVLYVKADAIGAGHGTSWPDAYTELQTALEVAGQRAAGARPQIWVAAGTYRPDRGCADRVASFVLLDGVSILGGFDGTESSAAQRDPALNPTMLSGDLAGDDAPGFVNRSDNSLHVVWAGDVDATAVLDGFVIVGGYADAADHAGSRGAGAWIERGSPTFASCVFRENRCTAYGGAVHVTDGGAATFVACRFEGNEAGVSGGGVEIYQAEAAFHECEWTDNFAVLDGGALHVSEASAVLVGGRIEDSSVGGVGGGIVSYSSDLTCSDATFLGNVAPGGGGALVSDSALSLNGCRFESNSAPAWDAGAVWLFPGSGKSIVGCTFAGNTCAYSGAALQSDAQLTLSECVFESNVAGIDGGAIRLLAGASGSEIDGCQFTANICGSSGGAVAAYDLTSLLARECQFEQNEAFAGGALRFANCTGLTIEACALRANTATYGGAVDHVADSDARFADCSFENNEAVSDAGAVSNYDGSSLTFERCRLAENSADWSAGAVTNQLNSTFSATNCLFDRNSASFAAGLRNGSTSVATLINCTLAANDAEFDSAGLLNEAGCNATLENCIVWGNTAPASPQILNLGSLSVSFSCVEGGFAGVGNISTNPRFTNPAAAHFAVGHRSPCADAGRNDALPPGTLLDLPGNARFAEWPSVPDTGIPGNGHAAVIDMGAFELQPVSSGPAIRRDP